MTTKNLHEISRMLAYNYKNKAVKQAHTAVDDLASRNWQDSDHDEKKKKAPEILRKRLAGIAASGRASDRDMKRTTKKWKDASKAKRDAYFAKHGKENGYHETGNWVGRVHKSDPDHKSKLDALKKAHGSLNRKYRLGKNNPHAHLYKHGGGESRQYIRPEHGTYFDLYKRSRNESVSESKEDSVKHMVASMFGAMNKDGKINVKKQRELDIGKKKPTKETRSLKNEQANDAVELYPEKSVARDPEVTRQAMKEFKARKKFLKATGAEKIDDDKSSETDK